jgi:hypothetical protein
MGLLDFFKKGKDVGNNNPSGMTEKVSKVADQLDQLGHFKYADPSDVEQLRQEIAVGLADNHYMAQVEGPGPDYKEMDVRHYRLDGEDLFEMGGILDALAKMTPFFQKLNISLVISDHLEDYDVENQWIDHEITINGKKYVIFKNFSGHGGWGEAAQRFADMINDQLTLHGVDEQLYLINGGNDGRAIFLTEDMYALARHHIRDLRERPLKTKEWCQVNSVEYTEVV